MAPNMNFATSSPVGNRLALLVAASASAFSLVLVSEVLRPTRRVGRKDDIEIYSQGTERNQKIISQAADLRSEPWGFGNRHFASILAQVRISPFWGDWGRRVTRRVSSDDRNSHNSATLNSFEMHISFS